MVINFNDCNGGGGGITITGTTGTLNLSTASADEVKAACENMDQYVFLCNYYGKTYVEEMRNDAYSVYFYVTYPRSTTGGTAPAIDFQLRETMLTAVLHPDTGAVEFKVGYDGEESTTARFAPNIIYNLNSMSPEKRLELRKRLQIDYFSLAVPSSFIVRWYDGVHHYIWTGNYNNYPSANIGFEGYSIGLNFSGATPKVMLSTDLVKIEDDGSLTHVRKETYELAATPI